MRAHRFLFREDIRTIRGVDMHVSMFPTWNQLIHNFTSGTGASVIYPLLACKMEPSWDFIATGKTSNSFLFYANLFCVIEI